ncbi:hypothetical protein OKW42_008938 [Paraburkholderia sp. WC7.3d]
METKVPKLLRRGESVAPRRTVHRSSDRVRYIRLDITEWHWIKEASGHGVYAGAAAPLSGCSCALHRRSYDAIDRWCVEDFIDTRPR